MTRTPTLILSISLLTSACATKSGEEFRGHWAMGAEGETFQPCGTTEQWWATVDSALQANPVVETTMVFIAADADTSAPKTPSVPPPFFMELRGDTSPVGAYGPDGKYRRHLVVRGFGSTTGRCP